jgi:hypothetical protein
MNKSEILDELVERYEEDDTWVDFIAENKDLPVSKFWEALLVQIEIADNPNITSLDYIFDNYEQLHEEYKNGE